MNNPNLQVSTLLNPDDSRPRSSVPSTPTSARVPPAGSTLPSINQGFDPTNQHRGSVDYHPSVDSRRSSVDSRMHTGFTNLVLNNPTSPYESQNASQVSLAASLRRPTGVTPMSPLSGRNSMRAHHPAPRIAPPIAPLRQPGAPDPMAAKPTQGYAWAFPEAEEQQRRGSSSDDSIDRSFSRQNSFAASSIRSSILSMDSHLPPGQRRFDEGMKTTLLSLVAGANSCVRTSNDPPSFDAAQGCRLSAERIGTNYRQWKLQPHSRAQDQPQACRT